MICDGRPWRLRAPPGLLLVLCLPAGLAGADSLDAYLFADNDTMRASVRSDLPDHFDNHWLQEPQLRIAPEVDIDQKRTETYSFRFRPVSARTRRAASDLFHIENEFAIESLNQTLGEALADRYHLTIELAAREFDVVMARHRLNLDRSVLDSQRALTAGSGYSEARLLNAALRLEQREQDLQQATEQVDRWRHDLIGDYLAVAEGEDPALSGRLIGPASIGPMLDRIADEAATLSPEGRLAGIRVRRAFEQITLDKSQIGFGLNLVELSYENKGIDSYNLTFGFRLPFARRGASSQRKVREWVTARREADLTGQRLTGAVAGAVRTMRLQIDSYADDTLALQRLADRARQPAMDGQTYAVVRRHQLDRHQSAVVTHVRLLHHFVDLLLLTGHLQQQPLSNWIRSESP